MLELKQTKPRRQRQVCRTDTVPFEYYAMAEYSEISTRGQLFGESWRLDKQTTWFAFDRMLI